jgi:hypothetical protein
MRTKNQALKEKVKKVVKLMIEAEHQPLVAEVEANLASIVRKDTDKVYLTGYQLSRVKAVLPDGTYEKWIKARCGYTSRQARYYVAVHENLQGFRERLVAAGVAPTVLYVLSSAEPEKIEEVLAVVEQGERVTVGQIKRMIKPETEVSKKPAVALGGAAGLRRAGEARMKADLDVCSKLTKRSLKAVDALVADLLKGKHVAKTKLASAVEADCQKAGILLQAVISPYGSNFPLPVEWEKARRIVSRLGDAPRYPNREEFPDWLVNEALPALRFVVLGEAFPDTASVDHLPDEANLIEMNTSSNAFDGDDDAVGMEEGLDEEADGEGDPNEAAVIPARALLDVVPSIEPEGLSALEPEAQAEAAALD